MVIHGLRVTCKTYKCWSRPQNPLRYCVCLKVYFLLFTELTRPSTHTGPQPLEVISLITKLNARDRRRIDGQEHECSSAMLKTAQGLDQLTIEICCPGAEMKDRMNDVVQIMKRGLEEVGVDFHGSVQEYAINILAMCEHFVS